MLVGDITKSEPFVERVRFAPGAEFPLHTHPHAEVVTVLSGAFGSTFDSSHKAKGQVLLPGSVLVVPGGSAHYVWAGDEGAVVQVRTPAIPNPEWPRNKDTALLPHACWFSAVTPHYRALSRQAVALAGKFPFGPYPYR